VGRNLLIEAFLYSFMTKSAAKPVLTLEAIEKKNKEREAKKKKMTKKSEADEAYDEAYKMLLAYREGYTVDKDESAFCGED